MTKREAAIQCAQDQYCAPSGNSIELDENPETIESMNNAGSIGVWVQTWVFIRNEDIEAELKSVS